MEFNKKNLGERMRGAPELFNRVAPIVSDKERRDIFQALDYNKQYLQSINLPAFAQFVELPESTCQVLIEEYAKSREIEIKIVTTAKKANIKKEKAFKMFEGGMTNKSQVARELKVTWPTVNSYWNEYEEMLRNQPKISKRKIKSLDPNEQQEILDQIYQPDNMIENELGWNPFELQNAMFVEDAIENRQRRRKDAGLDPDLWPQGEQPTELDQEGWKDVRDNPNKYLPKK